MPKRATHCRTCGRSRAELQALGLRLVCGCCSECLAAEARRRYRQAHPRCDEAVPNVGQQFHAIQRDLGNRHHAGPFVCGARLGRQWVRSVADQDGDYWTFEVAKWRFEILNGDG